MTKHYVHYLTRRITSPYYREINKPFYAENQNQEDGFERPMYHITRGNSGPAAEIGKGDVIWLFSTLKTPWGTLPPSLDGKFIVDRVESLLDGRTKFHANKDSTWFPISDASNILENLVTIDRNDNEKKLWVDKTKSLGLYLQSIRKLKDYDILFHYSNTILNSQFDFISYRIKDGTEPAFLKTENLVKNGKVVFWDRYSLPRRLVERRENVGNEMLNRYLLEKIKYSFCVWGIETNKYAETGSYSLKESMLAKEMNKYYPVNFMKCTTANERKQPDQYSPYRRPLPARLNHKIKSTDDNY